MAVAWAPPACDARHSCRRSSRGCDSRTCAAMSEPVCGDWRTGDLEAIVLACAGLQRLGLDAHITQTLEPEQCLPAIGQGALGIEIATGHTQAAAWVAPLNDPDTATAVTAERTVSHALSGSCQIPLAAHALSAGTGKVHLRACLARPDGSRILQAEASGTPRAAGKDAAQQLLEQGGAEILAELGVPLAS